MLRPSTKKKKKEANNKDPDQMPLYATSDQDLHGLGINLTNLGQQTLLIKTKKMKKKTGVFKQCIRLPLSVKATFDLLDTPTAPDVLQSQCIHTCHTN